MLDLENIVLYTFLKKKKISPLTRFELAISAPQASTLSTMLQVNLEERCFNYHLSHSAWSCVHEQRGIDLYPEVKCQWLRIGTIVLFMPKFSIWIRLNSNKCMYNRNNSEYKYVRQLGEFSNWVRDSRYRARI